MSDSEKQCQLRMIMIIFSSYSQRNFLEWALEQYDCVEVMSLNK